MKYTLLALMALIITNSLSVQSPPPQLPHPQCVEYDTYVTHGGYEMDEQEQLELLGVVCGETN